MRKRIANINEAPISADERRIAVEDDQVQHNSWLTEQGLAKDLNAQFPLQGGNAKCY